MCKKIVIIGAGLSGLTAGIYARLAGYETAIYEKHKIAGGECTGWDRKGYHIDNCIHWLMGCVPGSGLYDIWHTTGAIDEDNVYQQECMYTSELAGEKITLWKDADRTERELLALSPEDTQAIKELMHHVRLSEKIDIPCEKPSELMGVMDGVKMLFQQRTSLKIFSHYKGMDTRDLMMTFQHPLIRCMLTDFVTPEAAASSFPMAYGSYIAGNGGVPKGGSRAMALRMADRFKKLGGQLYTSAPVQKILHDDSKCAQGILLESGEKVEADYIVPACDTAVTFYKLLDESYMDPLFKEMYGQPENYKLYSMFQTAYAVDDARDVIGQEYILPVEEVKTEDWMGERMTIKCYSYEPSFAPEGKQIVQVLWGGSVAGYDFFKQLYQEPEKYNSYKKEVALKLMKKIEARFPAYKEKMSLLDVWTPVTYERYCQAYKGYNQAFVPTKYTKQMAYPSAYIQGLDNIVLAGQWLTPPGGCPGAAIQGKYAIMRIQHKDGKKA